MCCGNLMSNHCVVIGAYLWLRDMFARFIGILLCSLDEGGILSKFGVSTQL